MKITKVILKNFLGLYNGSGKKSIEIDFSKGSENKITILSGGNGKGKSFLISCLHPFASTLDSRSKIIIDGETGYKEIHYDIDSDRKAIIKHHYNPSRSGKITMKSFFQLSEDGGKTYKELNPNGGVTLFKSLILTHLEVDESYFKIARVGTNVTNFIDMPTAERKKYISLFLPDVDIYLESYKKINEKYNALNKNIKFVTQEINKLDDEDNLKSNLENVKNTLVNIVKRSDTLKEELNINLGSANQIDPDGSFERKFLDGYNAYKTKKAEIEKLKAVIERLINDVDSDKNLNELTIDITKLLSDIANLKDRQRDLHITLTGSESELDEKKVTLERFTLDTEDELTDILRGLDERINELQNLLKSPIYTGLSQYQGLNLYTIKKGIDLLKTYKSETKIILDAYDLNIVNQTFEDLLSGINTNYKDELLKIKQEVSSLRIKVVNYERKKRELMTKTELADVLANRPKECSIDTCPFIAKALEYKDVDKEIKSLSESIEQIENEISELNKVADELSNKSNLTLDIKRLYRNMDLDILKQLPYYERFSTELNFYKFFRKDTDVLVDFQTILTMNETLDELKDIKNEHKLVVSKLDSVKERQQTVSIIEKDCKRLNQIIDETNKKIIENDTIIYEKTSKLKNLNDTKTKLEILTNKQEELETLKIEVRELSIELGKQKEKVDELKKIKQTNKSLYESIEKAEKERSPLEKEKERLMLNLRRLNDFKESKAELEKDYYDLSVIRDALSNTKGIPLLFIELYLKKIKTIANELLDISFNGKFFIEDFVVTESDFFISVRKSEGEPVGDISQASQGEQALTSIALSFALVQQSTKAYNVLALDEMDSTLDSNNRRSFIDVVEAQLKEMNVEQCFIISHNEAFDTYPVNLILFEGTNVDLNDSEYMKNKKVLYQNK